MFPDSLLAAVDDATVVGAFRHEPRNAIGARRTIPERTLAARVEDLERKVEVLEALPARVTAVELQIVQLRTEMGEQFSAIQQKISVVNTGLRDEIRALRTELRAEIREGDEETRRHMRVLQEEVLSRIASIQERPPRRRRR